MNEVMNYLKEYLPWAYKMYIAVTQPSEEIKEIEFIAIILGICGLIGWLASIKNKTR